MGRGMTQATNQAGEHAGSKPSSGGGEEDTSHTLRMFATLFPSLNKCQGPNWCHKGIHTYGMETVHPSFTLLMTTVSACPLLSAQVAGRGKGDRDRQLARASCSHYSLDLMKLHQAGNSFGTEFPCGPQLMPALRGSRFLKDAVASEWNLP